MDKRLLAPKSIIRLITATVCFFFLVQCELILGNGDSANVGIDLSQFYGGSGRAVSNVPVDIHISEIHISVFGPGMEPIEKIVSAGARFVNMYVPAGEDRCFTLEVFFTYDVTFTHPHLRSYKGRSIADLRPGRTVGLKFQMVAGASQLLAPDYLGNTVFFSENLGSFNSKSAVGFGYPSTLIPTDMDLAADGRIFITRNAANPGVIYADRPVNTSTAVPASSASTAIAMDRDTHIDINNDGFYETNLLYVTNGNSLAYVILDSTNPMPPALSLVTITTPGMDSIDGMTVDPWTHLIYLVGMMGKQPTLVEYDPTYRGPTGGIGKVNRSLNHTAQNAFLDLRDVIVKDDRIFILNNPPLSNKTAPVVIVLNKNLEYVTGFGRVSSDATGAAFIPSASQGDFYRPRRFIAQENDGLFILDDSNLLDDAGADTYDKVVFIDTNLDPATWATFPSVQPVMVGASRTTGEPFRFMY
jgi:hypothetical protein